MHTLIGGISAEVGGGSFSAGAAGAGSAEASRNLLKNLSPDLQQWGSAIIGAATAKVIGNNDTTTGAATAISGTANNDLAHQATGIAKGVIDGLKNDAQGLWSMFANFSETIGSIKDAAGVIYDLGKEQGFGEVFKQLAVAVGGEWVSKYDKIKSDFANGKIDENTYDYQVGMLSGEVAYFMATTIPAPEKLSLSPKLVGALGKISKAKELEFPVVVVTAEKVKLLSSEGKFIDRELETSYQKYLSRKASEGKVPRDRLEWKETKDYWLNDSPMARGNAFNKKAEAQGWYKYYEINLSNGKRLDSYDPKKGEIVSRKATNLADVELSTFETYLKELNNKYPEGTIIRSNKYCDIDGQALHGTQILEIPASNKSFSKIQEYIDLAKNKYDVTIRFREE